MSEWIDGNDTLVGSQYPFSAMATVDLIGGNLERLYDQSGWQIQVANHEAQVAEHVIAAADTWYSFTDFGEIPIVPRPDRTGFRAIKISAEIKTSAGDKTEFRFFLLPGYYAPTPDSTTGYSIGYATIDTDSSSYSTKSGTIAAADVEHAVRSMSPPEEDDAAPGTETHHAVLVCLVAAADTGTASLRSLHIEEVVA